MDNSNRSFLDHDENMENKTVDEIIGRIRQELARRQNRNNDNHKAFDSDSSSSFHFNKNLALPKFKSTILSSYPAFSRKNNGEYHVRDLLPYHQEEFVRNAYIAVLGREADPVGMNIFLTRLDRGMSKIEILGRLRYSPEGRKKGVKIRGLFVPLTAQMIYKMPVIGYLCRLGISLLRLPKALKDRIDFEQSSLYQNKIFLNCLNQNYVMIENYVNRLNSETKELNDRFIKLEKSVNQKFIEQDDRLNKNMAEINTRINELEVIFDQKLGMTEKQVIELQESLYRTQTTINEQVNGLKTFVDQKMAEYDQQTLNIEKSKNLELQDLKEKIAKSVEQIRDNKMNLLDQGRRLKLLLEEARKRLPGPMGRKQLTNMLKEEEHFFDAMYVSLEDQFRGSRQDIKERLTLYLPIIQKSKAGSSKRPILDLGCGRGEWLEILEEKKLVAHGLDRNLVLIQQCKEKGLNVVQGEIIEYLKNLPDSCLGAVTGFHIVEHLSFDTLLMLIEHTVRVLKHKGIAIFETPNPENLIVGACDFYIDPTHRNPLPPSMLKFIAESRGLCDVEIKRMHPFDYDGAINHDNSEIVKRFNKYFYGPRDYAIIGYKS